ncbi:MAG: hypothetical protein ACLFRV_05390 [Acidimicrobiales bacterium]
MATIRASCDSCGDVEFTATQVTVHAPEDGGAGTYTFSCPHCRSTVVRQAERPTMDLLIAAGVTHTTWRRPAELVEREHQPDQPITHDELVAFGRLVEDEAALQAALEAIEDPRPR